MKFVQVRIVPWRKIKESVAQDVRKTISDNALNPVWEQIVRHIKMDLRRVTLWTQ